MEDTNFLPNSIILVDFENIGESGVKYIIKQLKGKNVHLITIFYSESNKSITIDTMKDLIELNAKIEPIKVKVGGKNALDFQLSSYLGYLIGKHKNEMEYYIVSNDKGFDYVISFWNNNNIKRLNTNVNQEGKEQSNKENTSNKITISELKKVLNKRDNPEIILEIFNRYKTRMEIVNGLQIHFRNSQKAGCIYKKLKPFFDKYNK